jgi:hypothetical protein
MWISVKMSYIKPLKSERWNLPAKTVGYSSCARCLTARCARDVRRNVTGLTILKFVVARYLHAHRHLVLYGLLSFTFRQLLELTGK